MTSSDSPSSVRAQGVSLTDDSLVVELTDGRVISVPLTWFPRLLNAGIEQRANWQLLGEGEGIHWPDADEDISVEGLLRGLPSLDGRQRAMAE